MAEIVNINNEKLLKVFYKTRDIEYAVNSIKRLLSILKGVKFEYDIKDKILKIYEKGVYHVRFIEDNAGLHFVSDNSSPSRLYYSIPGALLTDLINELENNNIKIIRGSKKKIKIKAPLTFIICGRKNVLLKSKLDKIK